MHLQRREVIEIVLRRGVGCCLEKLPSSCTLRHENVCTLWAIDEERVGTRLNGRHNLCNRPFPLALHACVGNVALPIFADVFDHCICHSCTPIRLVPPYVGSSPSSHAALTGAFGSFQVRGAVAGPSILVISQASWSFGRQGRCRVLREASVVGSPSVVGKQAHVLIW